MSSKTKKTSRGKRYTDAEKAEIVDFVNNYNAKNGRGGQSAGSKKFKISPLTISSWLKKSGAPKKVAAVAAAPKATGKRRGRPPGSLGKKRGRPPGAVAKPATSAPIGRKLAQLQTLHGKIESAEAELANLRVQFDVLKGSL